MIYSRQKGELMVSENRSEAESCAFIGKWCISNHSSFKYIKGAQSFCKEAQKRGREGNCSVLAGNGMGSHLQCSYPMGPWAPVSFHNQTGHPGKLRHLCFCKAWTCITATAIFLEFSDQRWEIAKRQPEGLNVGDRLGFKPRLVTILK